MPRIGKLLVFDTIFLFNQGFERMFPEMPVLSKSLRKFRILHFEDKRGREILLLTLDRDPTRLVRGSQRLLPCLFLWKQNILTACHRKGTCQNRR